MLDQGLADAASVKQAKSQELRISAQITEGGMEHLALGLAHHRVPSGLPAGEPYVRLDTTIDSALQREVSTLSIRAASEVRARGASALSVIVVDNATGDVLSYVGSQDYFGKDQGGANDGVLARRQPGSALKPFVYAAAIEELGMTAATLLPDVEVRMNTKEGVFIPKNYDGKMHGPVRLRDALASSLNVPAVVVAEQVGPAAILERLHREGFESLDRSASHYGAAIALGDGEVRLFELAQAYAMLARGGELQKLSFVRSAVTASGLRVTPERPTRAAASGAAALGAAALNERVLEPRTAAILTDILSDDSARASSFGRDSALSFDFPVAAKTGTSKGYRDNWTAGFTHEVTVAVWVGNFDGSPMIGSSGVTGAAPLFHDVMLAAMRGRAAAPLVNEEGLVRAEVCALSGARPGAHCGHRTHELFLPDKVPAETCSMHVRVRVDPSNGLRAGPACRDAVERTFEAYPPRYLPWATRSGRPLAPERSSPRCPDPGAQESTMSVASIRYPDDGARFVLDPEGQQTQEIVFAARATEGTRKVRFVLDGRALGAVAAPFELPWRLMPGRHRLALETDDGARAEPVTFEVARAE
jgi:penicillin-binding protein 1C